MTPETAVKSIVRLPLQDDAAGSRVIARERAVSGTLSLLVLFASSASVAAGGPERVTVLETPSRGIQPQAVIDSEGVIHLLYFKGEPGGGDLFYARKESGRDGFSEPIRVNSQPGSAIATGTIRGGQVALGKGGRIHVAWNGSGQARPKNPINGSPMLYARSNTEGTAFETQRNLMQLTSGLDGGGTVAADSSGRVYVAWHGRAQGARDGEMGRRMWVARSQDEGASFSPEEPAFASETGACGCCGTRAFADSGGNVYMLYRAATQGVDRDMILLASRNHGERFQGISIDRWRLNACPMSSESLAEGPTGVLAAWQTQDQVFFARIDPLAPKISTPVAPAGPARDRKHPALAVNARGQTILVWTEGTGWQKGGNLVWQVFDASGGPSGPEGRIDGGVPVWGLPTVVAQTDGSFTIIH